MANREGGNSGAALAARSTAVASLIAQYPEEFGKLHKEAREARGLTADPGGETNEELLARLQKNKDRQEKLENELKMRGVKVS
jgi:hypothetical protein